MKRFLLAILCLFLSSTLWAADRLAERAMTLEDRYPPSYEVEPLPSYTQESRAVGPITEPVQLASTNPYVAGAGVSAGGSGEFGYTTVGSSSGALGGGGGPIRCSGKGTPTNTGTVTKISIYSANTSATNDIKVGLYTVSTDDLTTLIGTETPFTDTGTWSAGWKEFTVKYSVTAGTYYAICISAYDDTAVTIYNDEATGVKLWYENNNYGDAWPSPITEDSTGAYNLSFKAYYTW